MLLQVDQSDLGRMSVDNDFAQGWTKEMNGPIVSETAEQICSPG